MTPPPTPRSGPPTICKCGSARSYHRPQDHRDHEYEPRYEPLAWQDGYERGEAEARAGLDVEALRPALEAAGFEPDFNVCRGCKHHGSRHDLSNRCLDCIEQVDDYFTSMSKDEQWEYGLAKIAAAYGGQGEERA